MIKKDKIEILIVTMEEDSFEIYHDIDLSTLSRKKVGFQFGYKMNVEPKSETVIMTLQTYLMNGEKEIGMQSLNPSLTPTFAYSWQSSYFPRFSYGLCVLQILFFLYGECFKFNLSYICFACFEGLLHWRISMFSPNGFFPFVVTSFWVLIRRTISVQ